jgi:DDE superfamily endonuclease
VVCSDESYFWVFHWDGRKRVWRRAGERYRASCLKPTVKGGGGSVMVWGCISWWGVGPLVLIEDTLNQDSYVSLLSKHLVPYLRQVDEQCPGVIFQEDNAPCHVGKYTAWWQQTHSINRMPWPAQSPDLNPIEHLWDHLDRQIRKRRPLPTSSAGLAAALQEEWGRIPLSVVRKLISSMPTRVAAVVKAGGLHIPY